MTSRERILAALEGRAVDYTPCSFMIFKALRDRCRDDEEFVRRQVDLGLDAFVNLASWESGRGTEHPDLPGPLCRYAEGVEVREWREDGSPPTLHKEYATPAGRLTAIVEETEDWPYPGHVPLFDDYLVPRSRKFLVEDEGDLEALRYVLALRGDEEASQFRAAAQRGKELAAELGVLVVGGMGIGLEATAWLCGMEQTVLRAVDEPEFVGRLVELLHEWNMARMQVVLDCGVDLFWRRGWYEGTDFWSPTLYRELVFPYLRREAELAHEAGAKFGYINTSGTMAILPQIIEAGVDVVVGVDPIMGKDTDMAALKEAAGEKLCLWGGVNGFLTVERGTQEEIEDAVREAMAALGPEGFILSPVDNVRDASDEVWARVLQFIEAWKGCRAEPE